MVRMTLRRVLLSALLVACGAAARADTLFVLELKGGARVFALDHPAEKGHTLVFHRHPDGVFTSLPTEQVSRIARGSSADLPRTQKIQPGELMVLGRDIDGSAPQAIGLPPVPAPARVYEASDYGAYDMYGYGYGFGYGSPRPPHHRPQPPPRPVPTTIGPNGYPIIAPPGAPGSTVPPTGSNGFPIIAPLPGSFAR